MTTPSNADPQAELREAIVIKLNSMFGQNYVETDEGTLFTTEIADDLVALFQAHQQELLSELLGEQKHYWTAGTIEGERVEAIPVSAIEKYREGL